MTPAPQSTPANTRALVSFSPLRSWPRPHRARSAQTVSDTPRPELWVTNGLVYSIVQSCDTLYIGGSFSQVGPYTGTFAAIDAASALPDPAFPKVNGFVGAIASDGAGGWYIGGEFTTIGCDARNGLAHIRADRTVNPAWNPNVNGAVYAIALSGNTVYVGGLFTSIGGQTRNRIAALDATKGYATDWNPGANHYVFALAVSGNIVYAGGYFTSIGGQTRDRIAALDATTGLATAWNPSASGGFGPSVYTLVVSGNAIYAGGTFTSIGGQTRNRIAALDATSGLATAWNPNASGAGVGALAISGNTVYAGGSFNSIGGQTRNHIAALDATTGQATAWDPNANLGVDDLAISGGTVYAGGSFTSIGGQTRNYIAAIDATTGAATDWNPNTNDSVGAVAVSGSTVYAGGGFSSVGAQSRNNIAALDTTSGAATAWNPNAVGSVRALAVAGGAVYAGGFFTSIGGQTRNYLAAIDATTGAATAWDPNANLYVYDLAVSGSTVYAGGTFTSIGGQSRNYIAALDATTGAAMAWDPNANSGVSVLAVSSGTVYAGGSFTSIGGPQQGQPRNYIAAIDATTGAVTAWDPNANFVVHAMTLSGGTVFAGGEFTSIGGQSRNNIAAIDATTGLATVWNPNAGNTVNALAVSGNIVYAGGLFTSIGGQTRNYIAALDASSGAATAWDPNLNDYVEALAVSGSTVYAGGWFYSVGGEYRPGLAGFSISNSDWANATGLWIVAANWSPPVVPNNTGCDQYNVRIAGAASQVTLDIDATINTLALESNASLLITGGDLTIASPEGIANAANIFVGPGHALIAGTATNVCGVSPIELAGIDAALSSTAAVNTIRLSAPVVGFGVIDAAFQNQSTINANASGETLEIGGALSATSGGEMRATNGGTLRITRSLGGASAFVADGGGVIDIPGSTAVTVAGSTANVSNGGQWRAGGQAAVNFSGDVEIGCGGMRGCTPPVLEAIGTSTTTVGGNLLLSGLVDLTVGPGTEFELAADFVNECTSPTTFEWEAGPLTMNGTAPQTFEAAGEDLGPFDANGFINNFALGTLRLEPGRTVDLVNNFDNMPGAGCEALYVDTLSLGAGATFRLNGCNVYFNTLIKEPGATVVLENSAALMSTDAGDLDGDDDIDFDDANQFTGVLLGGSCSPACLALADINGDGTYDGLDIALMTRLLIEWPLEYQPMY